MTKEEKLKQLRRMELGGEIEGDIDGISVFEENLSPEMKEREKEKVFKKIKKQMRIYHFMFDKYLNSMMKADESNSHSVKTRYFKYRMPLWQKRCLEVDEEINELLKRYRYLDK